MQGMNLWLRPRLVYWPFQYGLGGGGQLQTLRLYRDFCIAAVGAGHAAILSLSVVLIPALLLLSMVLIPALQLSMVLIPTLPLIILLAVYGADSSSASVCILTVALVLAEGNSLYCTNSMQTQKTHK